MRTLLGFGEPRDDGCADHRIYSSTDAHLGKNAFHRTSALMGLLSKRKKRKRTEKKNEGKVGKRKTIKVER